MEVRFAMSDSGIGKDPWLVGYVLRRFRSTHHPTRRKSEFQQVFPLFPICFFLLIFRREAVNGRGIPEALPMDIDE